MPSGTERGLSTRYWVNDVKPKHLSRKKQVGKLKNGTADDVGSVLQAATTFDEAFNAAHAAIFKQLAMIFALQADEIVSARSLDSYAVDSLVGVESRNWISAYLQVNLPLLLMWITNSIDELTRIVTKGPVLVTVKAAGTEQGQ